MRHATCTTHPLQVRCQRSFLNMSSTPAYRPGDMDVLFRSFTGARKKKSWTVTYLSRDPYLVQVRQCCLVTT